METDMPVRESYSDYWSGCRMLGKIQEIYNYREMIVSLVKRELRGKYKASVLGFLWTFLNPLFQMLVYTIVFSYILESNIDNFPIFLFIGLIPWNFFGTAIASGAACVVNQENLIKKIYFPRIVLPISYVTSMFINMLLTFIVIFVAIFVTGYGINPVALLFLPLVMLTEYILALGICMLASALTVYFRDLEYILGILNMAWMYLTPILYTIDMVPEDLRFLLDFNPMTPIILAYREILYYKQVPQMTMLLQAGLFGGIILIIGIVVFEKIQRRFVEEL